MTPADLRFYLVLFVCLALAIAKLLQIIYRRGRQSILRENFSFLLPRDESVRQRL